MDEVEEIKKVFEKTPDNLQKIRELLSSREFSKEELAKIANYFTENCFCEYMDACDPRFDDFSLEDMRSNHIVDAIKLLIEYGLDPNVIVNNENVIWNTIWIDAPGVAPAVMKVLLENGGNPNHFLPSEQETVFEYIDYKVSFDEYTYDYLHTVKCWLILMAYGACWQDNGKIPLTMLGENSVEIFKNYELFDYAIERLPQIPGEFGCCIMHIFNIETKEEVAVYK